MQLASNNPAHFACLKDLCNVGNTEYLGQFITTFEWSSQVFDEPTTEFKIFCSPLFVTPSAVPTDIQLEMIDLQCCSNIKEMFDSADLEMLETSYLCEQVFSAMSINKNRLHSRSTR